MDALKEFYADRDAQQKYFEDLKVKAEDDANASKEPLTMDAFNEDWNSSQFWVCGLCKSLLKANWSQYSQETATVLANQLLEKADSNTTIAVVSAPSVFVQLKNILV